MNHKINKRNCERKIFRNDNNQELKKENNIIYKHKYSETNKNMDENKERKVNQNNNNNKYNNDLNKKIYHHIKELENTNDNNDNNHEK